MQQQAKQFINLLESQQLLSPDVLDELRRQVAESKSRLTTELLAKLLVDNGHLTKFQATKLIGELKDATSSSSVVSTAETDDGDELGFADEEGLGGQTKSKSKKPAGPKVAQVLIDDDDDAFDDDDIAEVVEVIDADVVEVVPVETVEVVQVVESSDSRRKRRAARGLPADASTEASLVDLSAGAKRVLPKKKSTANPYDSFRILGVGLLLSLFLIAGFFLVNYFLRGNAEDRLKRADEAYEQRSYETASVMYQGFAQDFPTNEQASYAKVRSTLAAIRKDAEGAPDPQLGLDTALRLLPSLTGEAALTLQQSDLAGALIALAGKFNERADRTSVTAERKSLMENMDKLLGLINDPQYVGANQRNQQAPTLNRIQEDRQRILREINRDEELAAALTEIDKRLAAKDTLGAYEVRKELINRYPLLEADGALAERVQQASVIQQSLVTTGSLDVKLSKQPPTEIIGRSFVLANRSGKPAPGLSGQVVFVKAKGSVLGIDATSGDILWRQFVGREFNSEPLRLTAGSTADAIICQPEQGEIARVAGKTGEPLWWAGLGKPTHNPVLESGDLFVATFDGTVGSLDSGGGQLKWATQLPQATASAPGAAFGKPNLYQPAEHSSLYVLSRADGACQEVFYLGHRTGAIVVPPVLVLGQLFVFENVTAQACKIRILATSDAGLELREAQNPITMEGNIVAPPQVDGRRLIVQTDLGQIKVLDIEPTVNTQKVSELVAVPKNVFSPKQSWLIVDNNRVWVVDSQLTRFDVQLATMSMSRAWIENPGDAFVGPPQRFGNTLIHARVLRGNQGIRVSAIEADTRNLLWETDVGMPVTYLAAAGSGYSALNTSGMVFALGNKPIRTEADSNPANGKSAMLFTNPTPLQDGRVVLLNRSRGNQLGIYNPTANKMSLLTADWGSAKATCDLVAIDDKVAVGLDSGQLVLLNLTNGSQAGAPYQPAMQAGQKVRWNTPVYLAASQTMIAASDLQKLVRLSVAADLRSLNEVTLENPLVGPIVAVGKQVCAVESTRGGDALQFFDPTSLKAGANVPLAGRLIAGPFTVSNSTSAGCVVQTDSQLMMISEDGQLKWSIDFPKSNLVGPPLPSGQNLIFVTRAGGVWSIATGSGQVVGNLDAGQALSSPPLVVSTNLLIGSDEGAVLALPLPTQPAETK